MMSPWLVLLGVLLWHARCILSWKSIKPCVIQTRLHVVVPQQPPAETQQEPEPEKQKPRWSIFGRSAFPSDKFPRMTTEEVIFLPPLLLNILKKGMADMDEVANFFSSARYGITKEVEMKEMEGKEMETKVSDMMKDLE